MSDLYVPGVMYCAKCRFKLVRTNLHVNSGTTSAGDNKTEPCPNGCGPLWPVTWEKCAREAMEKNEEDFETIKALQEKIKLLELAELGNKETNKKIDAHARETNLKYLRALDEIQSLQEEYERLKQIIKDKEWGKLPTINDYVDIEDL